MHEQAVSIIIMTLFVLSPCRPAGGAHAGRRGNEGTSTLSEAFVPPATVLHL